MRRRFLVPSLLLGFPQAQSPGPTPPPPPDGVTASVTVDNPSATAGQTVRVRVQVQIGTAQTNRVGSFTGRLRFDPERLEFRAEHRINDGLRVANTNGAGAGEIRFAGAAPAGFETLVLFDASFVVKSAAYTQNLRLAIEELSAATSLTDLSPQLRVYSQVFIHR